ncbi:MAG TPA: substrate-binding domain-containing protein [Pseudonocardiaceae bacterium]
MMWLRHRFRIGRRRGLAYRSASLLAVLLLGSALLVACATSTDPRPGVALILKTLTNPYFGAMAAAARAEAAKDDVRLSVAAGTADGDTQTQINAIYTAIARGDKGILVTSNGDAVNAAMRKARKLGLFVIALDTPPSPASTVDITYATDNEAAGRLVGRYAAAKLGGRPAVIAMLDLYNNQIVSVDVNRDHGFLEGMGIDPGSTTVNAKEAKSGRYRGGTYTIACHQPTQGAVDGGRTAMEQCLSANPDINVVYTINEPAGRGAHAALLAARKASSVMIVSIDGSCAGVQNVRDGVFAADGAQYPAAMAGLGVSSLATLAHGGRPPSVTRGKSFLDTGTALIASDEPGGLAGQKPDQAARACWGSPSGA